MKTLGQSSNFVVQIDDTKYSVTEQQNLSNLVTSVFLNSFETDYATLCGWYGVMVNKVLGSNNKATITFGNQASGAGSTSGYSQSNIWINISTLIGGTDSIRSTFAHEMNHILEGYKMNWTPTNSQGEGLCRAVADMLHPLPGSDEVNAWLAFDPTTDPTSAKADTEFRKDWVSVNFNGGDLKTGGWVNGMDDSYSIGCAILFIFYLRDQLGFSMNEICQSVGDTLELKYHYLTHGDISGFSQFKRLLDIHFPGLNNKCTPNNPFPLAFTNMSLSSAGRENNLFVFSRMLDGRIIFNQAAPGKAFVGWQEVPGGQLTDVALAAGMQHDTLFVFTKTLNGRIMFNQAAPGGAFVGWQEMPGAVVTNMPLASAGRQNNLFVFAKTLDGRIIFNQAAPGKA
ncbi:MAG: hypothetical protein Q8941_22725, partial [Bacteroidota bacterium]|nr:hypothetical protein [Bacteroidota bacterium]